MNNLELCKKFAELEGLEHKICELDGVTFLVKVFSNWHEYNPIADLALNCAARDKYKVEIDYDLCEANIFHPKEFHPVRFESSENIQRAVIMCILKSKGLI